MYVGSEYQRNGQQARDNGQIMKLDPRKPDDPLVWSVADHDASLAGVWATPAIADGMVYVATNGGRLLGIDAGSGKVRWQKKLFAPTWQSSPTNISFSSRRVPCSARESSIRLS